ncbi:DUF4382 domain-containing protein [Chitinophagaceae bacterium 26-R-25]|nr:DUF4382 domain-containing protein [Chitinophagaceae bacterium 26-R-25]
MKKNILQFLTLCLVVLAISFTACNKNDKSASGGTAKLELRLTDAPGNYDAVYIDIQSVKINATTDSTNGWTDVPLIKPGVYNLLDFRNGIDTLLASVDIPAGKISQIRLVLGSNNSVVVDGASYPLNTPSAQQSGLKLNLHADLTAGIVYRLWIDFDANKSVVATGSGKFNLKPVIRTYSEATGGTMQGTVLPPDAKATVMAINGTDTLYAVPSLLGFYRFAGVTAGSWNLYFVADTLTGYQNFNVANVSVQTGVVTTVPTVTLIK